jgi:hypothetical protein
MKRFLLPLLALLMMGSIAAPRAKSPKGKRLQVFMFPNDVAVAGAPSPRAMHASPRGGRISSRRSSRGSHTPVASRSKSPRSKSPLSHLKVPSVSAPARVGAVGGAGPSRLAQAGRGVVRGGRSVHDASSLCIA